MPHPTNRSATLRSARPDLPRTSDAVNSEPPPTGVGRSENSRTEVSLRGPTYHENSLAHHTWDASITSPPRHAVSYHESPSVESVGIMHAHISNPLTGSSPRP